MEKRMKSIASIRPGGTNKYADETITHLFATASFDTKAEDVLFIKGTILGTNHGDY